MRRTTATHHWSRARRTQHVGQSNSGLVLLAHCGLLGRWWGAGSFFSSAMGNARWLPSTGNVLLANAVLATKPFDRVYAQILEVTPDGTRLFELNVRGNAGSMYLMHRASRVADLRQ